MAYIGRGLQSGAFRQLDDISSGFDGSDTTHTMQVNSTNVTVGDVNQILLSLGGVIQKPGTDFTVSASVLTFTTAPAANTSFFAILLGSDNGGTTTPTDKSVTVGKIDINGGELFLDADDDTSITADTDDQIDFKAGGTDIMSLTATTAQINDALTVTVSDNSDALTIVSTDADAANGPNVKLFRNSSSPADGDDIGRIGFTGTNSAGETVEYVVIRGDVGDVTDGTEDGKLIVEQLTAGAFVDVFHISPTETVFNDASVDRDFRIESNANAVFFKIDANALSGQGAAGIGAVNTGRTFNVTTPSSYSQYTTSFINASSSAPYGLYNYYSGAAPDSGSDYAFLDCSDTSATRLVIYSDGDVKNHDNSYGQLSDQRIKDEIVDANSQWDDIKAVKVRNFKRKDDIRKYGADKAKVQIGLIAQELESVSPNLVDEAKPKPSDVLSSSEFGTLYEDGDTIPEGSEIGDVKEVKENVKGIKYSVLYMKAIKALQEAMAKIETLETKVKALEDA